MIKLNDLKEALDEYFKKNFFFTPKDYKNMLYDLENKQKNIKIKGKKK